MMRTPMIFVAFSVGIASAGCAVTPGQDDNPREQIGSTRSAYNSGSSCGGLAIDESFALGSAGTIASAATSGLSGYNPQGNGCGSGEFAAEVDDTFSRNLTAFARWAGPGAFYDYAPSQGEVLACENDFLSAALYGLVPAHPLSLEGPWVPAQWVEIQGPTDATGQIRVDPLRRSSYYCAEPQITFPEITNSSYAAIEVLGFAGDGPDVIDISEGAYAD